MNKFEKLGHAVRYSRLLRRQDRLWGFLRPWYGSALQLTARRGLVRNINGTDQIRILPQLRHMGEEYEPNVWRKIFSALHPGDTFVDIGAYAGVYSVVAAQHVQRSGRVIAFEPDPRNFALLRAQIDLNRVGSIVEPVEAAVGDSDGVLSFEEGRATDSFVSSSGVSNVRSVSLDTYFPSGRVDILKVDVEGHEAKVISGAGKLLSDAERSPRLIGVEMHPHLWSSAEEGPTILKALETYGYTLSNGDGDPLSGVTSWSWLIAHRDEDGA